MNKSVVALIRCADYEAEHVNDAVKRGIQLLGGISRFARPAEKIVLKPNLLIGVSPDKCVNTHPSVFKAVAQLFQQEEAVVSYGDSPAFGGCNFHAKSAGIKHVADELGLKMADFDHGREVVHKASLLNKRFILANGILDADGIVSLPKLKTHGFMRITGAVKNQFGCIPGILKGQFHARVADPYNFATMLVDINTCVRPRLYIMDAITAMEGNGPRSGQPRQVNVLIFSTDPVALDAIACKIINLDPEFVPTSQPGEKSGLGTYHYDNIEVVGDNIESFVVRDFQVTREPPEQAVSGPVRRFIKNRTTARPIIIRKNCTGCGICIKMCPVGHTALDWKQYKAGKQPGHNYSNCIRCYCCQETCPEGAIIIKTPLLGRLIFHKSK
jgi:uncharacterized protein (DUF362 family)/NAD-dependent dihydropyrimidine dehydrogenase PreA subunit